jgi:hypothetical protein
MPKVLACEMCYARTEQWVIWANWRGQVFTFCANDCLARWLERNLDDICRALMGKDEDDDDA